MKTSANGQKYFSFRSAKLWNSLPSEIKQALILLNIFYYGLGVFTAAGWLARSLSLCFVSARSGTEIYLWVFVVGLVGGGRGRESGWLLGRWGNS